MHLHVDDVGGYSSTERCIHCVSTIVMASVRREICASKGSHEPGSVGLWRRHKELSDKITRISFT